MADAPCAKFNNATLRLWNGTIESVVYVWETNDPDSPWRAEARLLQGDVVMKKFTQSSADRKQVAKDIAADTAWKWLCAQYPTYDLINV
ncbi:hypothetical protein H1R20_g6088, partial [Candolleomyces eurysporus]